VVINPFTYVDFTWIRFEIGLLVGALIMGA
jgi:hypothetical protein